MNKRSGFTIVELLVVIVVIGILAAITIVSYMGVSNKAIASSLQNDLSSSSKIIKMYYVENGSYPSQMTETGANTRTYCPTPVDARYCIKATAGNRYTYESTSSSTFTLTAINDASSQAYSVTESTSPAVATLGPPTVTIDTQVWMRDNINTGTRVNGGTNQALGQKWCYGDIDSNCTTYGALYQWDTAMNGDGGNPGICPTGFHVPSDNDWKTLEKHLGMSQAVADTMGDRGTNGEAAAMMLVGSGSLGAALSGGYNVFGYTNFANIDTFGSYWTSNEWASMPTMGLYRELGPSKTTVRYWASQKTSGMSVRCIKN